MSFRKSICFLTLITFALPTFAISGHLQTKTERIYDTFRTKYLEPYTKEQQVQKLTLIQKHLTNSIEKITSEQTLDIVKYLQLLFCHTESLLTGYYCKTNYYPESLLTIDISRLSIDEIRTNLIREHSQRREARGLGGLTESAALDAIAQSYAEKLCKAQTITHTLDNSTLEGRMKDGGYKWLWIGENLGIGQTNIMDILDELTTSLGHRHNMYQPEFTELGVGQCDKIWVLNYGKPRVK